MAMFYSNVEVKDMMKMLGTFSNTPQNTTIPEQNVLNLHGFQTTQGSGNHLLRISVRRNWR
jgi:hypothetical protein